MIRDDHKQRYHQVLKFAQSNNLTNAIDVQCGTGYGAAILAEGGLTVIAYDGSIEAIDTAKERHGQQVLFHQLSVDNLIVDQWDLVTLFDAINYELGAWDFIGQQLTNCRYLAASVLNWEKVRQSEGNDLDYVRHINLFDLKQKIDSLGWQIVQLGGQRGKHGVDAFLDWSMSEEEIHEQARTIVFIAEPAA